MSARLFRDAALALLLCGALLLAGGCVSSPPQNPALGPDPNYPEGWTSVDSAFFGFSFGIPPTWSVRADGPSGLAINPKSSVSAAIDSRDQVLVMSTSAYLSQYVAMAGETASPSPVPSVVSTMERDGFEVGDVTQVTFAGQPAEMVVGITEQGARYSIVSASFVIEADALKDSPPEGATTDNVLGILQSMGLILTH